MPAQTHAKDFLFGLVKLLRPLEWSKGFGNMAIAAIVASYSFNVQPSIPIFLTGFFAVSMLWSGLYALNDWTDREADKLHPVKKNRPIPSGRIPAGFALGLAVVLILSALAIGFSLGVLFFICLLAMLLNQLLYTLEPFSFKKRAIVDLISGSAINPVFRFYAGWVLLVPAFNAPLFALLFVVGVQFGGFTLYRLTSHSVEEKLGYKSSATVFGEGKVKALAYAAIIASALSYFAMALNGGGILNLGNAFGVLPFKFFWLGVLSLLALPLYANVLLNPKKADISKVYVLVYLNYIVFVGGMILLFFWQ